jgi:hypothetical protein
MAILRILLLFSLGLFLGCGGDSAVALQEKFDRLKLGMTNSQIAEIMGAGKAVTFAEIKAYPEFPTLNPADAPEDSKWTRWGEGYPYVLAAVSKDKLVLVRILGVRPSKK